MDGGLQARGRKWTPISGNSDGIPQYVQARRTVFILLSILLESNNCFWNRVISKYFKHYLEVEIFQIGFEIKESAMEYITQKGLEAGQKIMAPLYFSKKG